MATKSILLLVFSLLAATTTTSPPPTLTTDVFTELTTLRTQSPTGVIRLTDHLLRRITSLPTPRPFSLVIFFDAVSLHSKTELQLPGHLSEFSLLSSSFLSNHNNNDFNSDKLFFFQIEFKDSQRSFELFGVDTLPHVRVLLPYVTDLRKADVMDPSGFFQLVESLSEFISDKVGVDVGPINRQPLLNRYQLAFIIAMLAIWTPFAVRRVLRGETLLHDPRFWLFGAIFIYFFSVSGTMHNIIRQMPMFIMDRNDPKKIVYFYQGSKMQLGAEGFVVGLLFTIVGFLLSFVTHGLVRVRNVKLQRVLLLAVLVISFWAVKKVVVLDNWKTGYGIHAYWPSSW